MKIVESKDIDCDKWDAKIAASHVQNSLIYSWALSATASKWCAIIEDDYSFLLPITYREKLGVKRARQPEYSRQMDFVGDEKKLDSAIEMAKNHFKEFDIRVSENVRGFSDVNFQVLDLKEEAKYSSNATRLICKSDKVYTYFQSFDYSNLLELYERNSFLKFKQSQSNIDSLRKILEGLIAYDKAVILNASLEGEIVGALCVILEKETAFYLIGDADDVHKRNGVIYGLMNQAIELAKQKEMSQFDFGGSNVDSVAVFYKKFGAVDKIYTRLFWDRLPVWFKSLQRLKK